MMRRCVLAIAVSILIAASVTFAQEQGRQQKIDSTWATSNMFLGPCDANTAVFAAFEVAITQILHKDKEGHVISETQEIRTIKPSIYFLGDSSSTPIPNTKVAMGNPSEVQINQLDYVKMVFTSRGSIYQVTVPRYGRLFSETGLTVWDPATFAPLVNRGHNDSTEQDVAALCDYLSGR
jgi:hypothetical protein